MGSTGGRRVPQEEWDRRADLIGADWKEPVTGSAVKTRIQCRTCGHEWTPLPTNVYRGQGCPACGRRSQRAKRRRSMEEWNALSRPLGWEYVEQPVNTTTPARAKCLTCGYEWQAAPSRIYRGHGCNRCSRSAAGKRHRLSRDQWQERLDAKDIEIIGDEVVAGKKVTVRCRKCGHVADRVPSKICAGAGCPGCGHGAGVKLPPVRVVPRRTSVDVYERMAAAGRFRWIAYPEGKHYRAEAECLVCGHHWQRRGQAMTGCPRCAAEESGRRRSFSTEQLDAIAAKAKCRWLVRPPKRRARGTAECLVCGTVWEPMAADLDRTERCPTCFVAESALAKRVPQSVWDERGAKVSLRWLEDVTGSDIKTPAECTRCGFTWRAIPTTVNRGVGCPVCAVESPSWFRRERPSYVYLLLAIEDGAMKVGIMNRNSPRMKQHALNGYELVERWDCEDGTVATEIETTVLRWWRDELGLPPFRMKPQDGWSETVDSALVSVEATREKIAQVHAEVIAEHEAMRAMAAADGRNGVDTAPNGAGSGAVKGPGQVRT